MHQRRITVVEVGPRDGLQNERRFVSTDAKVAYVRRLVDAGLTRIEAVSFVHPRLVPQMADAQEVMARVPRTHGVTYIGLVLNDRGVDRAIGAGVDEANIVLVATETFSRKNQGMGVNEALVIRARAETLFVRVFRPRLDCPLRTRPGRYRPRSSVVVRLHMRAPFARHHTVMTTSLTSGCSHNVLGEGIAQDFRGITRMRPYAGVCYADKSVAC